MAIKLKIRLSIYQYRFFLPICEIFRNEKNLIFKFVQKQKPFILELSLNNATKFFHKISQISKTPK